MSQVQFKKHDALTTPSKNTSKKLITPSDLNDDARTNISTAINPLIADAFALFVKTKNYHWHVSGSHYRDYHLLLDEQATQIFSMIDTLAERIRKIGGTTIHSIKHISQLQTIIDDDHEFVEPQTMINNLMEENKNYTARMRKAHDICNHYRDVATASLLESFIDETEKRTWFLYMTLAK